jgi:hypothetical protein
VTYESGSNTVDVVWQPLFTPSRTPLLDQRWTALPASVLGIPLNPGGSQYGARFNHVGAGYEASVCFFDGYNNLPNFTATGTVSGVDVQRYYPKLRLYGADLAVPLTWFTVKTEGAYFTSSTAGADEYALYVIQLERQGKEWSFVGGYAGEIVTRSSGDRWCSRRTAASRDPSSAMPAGPSARIAASRWKHRFERTAPWRKPNIRRPWDSTGAPPRVSPGFAARRRISSASIIATRTRRSRFDIVFEVIISCTPFLLFCC